jgi:hypothetical protein
MTGVHISAFNCRKLWAKVKDRIKNNSYKSNLSFKFQLEENDYYKNLGLEIGTRSYSDTFRKDLEDKVKIYEGELNKSMSPESLQYKEQKSYTLDLIKDYASLTSTGERNKRECLRQLKTKLAEGPMTPLEGVVLEEERVKAIQKKLRRTREIRLIERERKHNKEAFDEPWTDVEKLNLLKGVSKHGEQAWSDILDKYNFQSIRTSNSLAYKWKQIKLTMLEDMQRIFREKGIKVTMWDWIQGSIHKLEEKCGYFIGQVGNKLMQSSWNQGGFLRPPQPTRTNISSSSNPLAAKAEVVDVKDKNYQENSIGGKKPNVIQLICNHYEDCLKKFQNTIDEGTFTTENVRKYIADRVNKESGVVYPKYFELHHVEQKAEEPKRTIFKLETKEEIKRSNEVATKTAEPSISLKKLFLQKKALLSDPEHKGEVSSKDPSNGN